MYAGVGIEQQMLSVVATGSARFVLRFSASSSSVSSSCAWARRSGVGFQVAESLGSEQASQHGKIHDGNGVVDGNAFWNPRKLLARSLHERICAKDFPARAARNWSLRPLSSLPSMAPNVIAGSAALTDGINTEERIEGSWKELILDGSRTTAIAHKMWQGVVRPGDTVIDATCGNGHDTLMLAKMVLRDGTAGYVIGFDLQQSALDNTSALLDRELNSSQRDKVSLLQLCHSQLDKVVDENSVRLVAFNLGYQPGGNKIVITQADTTVKALRAAVNVIEPQGLISILSYVGHPGGREEYDAVKEFVASLPSQDWVCSHLEWVNRPLCPHLMFLLRK